MIHDIELLYREYSKDIYSHLLYLTRDEPLSQDILQETFVQAIRSIGTFKGESSVKTWLFSIARHLWIAHLRKKRPELADTDIAEVVIAVDYDAELTNRELIKRIYEIINSKDEKVRRVVLMRLGGYSYFDISQKLSISESSARVIDFRCKKEIREILAREDLYEGKL